MSSSDAYTPTTTQDDSLFQGFVTLFRTQRAVPAEMPLPNRGDAVGDGWGEPYKNNIVIARGLTPDKSLRIMWIQHMAKPLSFAAQDNYNFTEDGTTLSRVYVMPRAVYLVGYDSGETPYYAAPPDAAAPLDTGHYAGSDYCYTGEKVDRIGTDPDSIFVAITRIWLRKTTVTKFHDDELDNDITQTRKIVKAGEGTASSSPGTTVRIEPGNRFIDYEVTEDVTGFTSSKQLRSLMADVPYKFPMLMTSAAIIGTWALADSSSAAASYQESFYFSYNLIEPTVGPYEARILRFLVADPDTLRTAYPIQKFVTRREVIGTCRAWAIASSKGNSASASAEEREVPPCIHGRIEISNDDTLSVGQTTDVLEATPNFDALSALSVMTVGYETTKTKYGLYLVEITQLNVTGIYNGKTTAFPPSGDPGGGTGAGDVTSSIIAPKIKTVAISPDNKTITGKADKSSQIFVTVGGENYGKAMVDSSENYSVPISPVPRDAIDFSIRARRNGVFSAPTLLKFHDLAPLAPSASISEDLSTVSGTSEPGTEISIYPGLKAQEETATVPSQYLQKEELVVDPSSHVTEAGNAKLTITSALVNAANGGLPRVILFPVDAGDDHSELEAKAIDALLADTLVMTHYQTVQHLTRRNGNPTFVDPEHGIPLYARVLAADDASLNIALENATSTGIVTQATSTHVRAGGISVSTTAAGTAHLKVTSKLVAPKDQDLYFAFASGNNAATIADKACTALKSSAIVNYYDISNSGANIVLTAKVAAVNDVTLNINLYGDEAKGLPGAPLSTSTKPSGPAFTTTANDAGLWAYTFDPFLVSGNVLSITASDDGGTSPITTVRASAHPPQINSAAFPEDNYNSIVGNATAGSTVVAIYKNEVIKTHETSSGGDGNYILAPLPTNYIHGELIEVYATVTATPDVRSASIYVTAANLHLTPPTLQHDELYPDLASQYTGLIPKYNGVKALAIKAQLDSGGPITTAILYDSGWISLSLPGENGQRWLVWASYLVGDSDPITIDCPQVDPRPAIVSFHYQGTIDYRSGYPDQLWPPETNYPGYPTVRITAKNAGVNDATLSIVIGNGTSTGISSGNSFGGTIYAPVPGTGSNYQQQTAVVSVTGILDSGKTAKITVKSSILNTTGHADLVITVPLGKADTPHIIAARVIRALNLSDKFKEFYIASSTGALNQIAITNPYPGACDMNITYPGQDIPDFNDRPATKALYDLYPSGYLNTPILGSDVPRLFSVKLDLFDGRSITTTFHRSDFAPYKTTS